MTDPNAYDALIGKFLAGETSPAEKAELMAWVQAAPANRQFFEEMQQLWGISAQYDPVPHTNTARAWQRLEDAIAPGTEHAAPHTPPEAGYRQLGRGREPVMQAFRRRPALLRPLLRIAAVLIPAALALWWWHAGRDAGDMWVSVQTAGGERREVQLPDGSTVLLNQFSTLSFRENDTARYVTLLGEAFFTVQHREGKPFVILSRDAVTTVLGTSFNVRAYPDEAQVEVSVVSGRVMVEAVQAPAEKAVLQAGQAAAVQKAGQHIALSEELAANAAAWKNRHLKFEETRLSEVAAAIERYFDVRVQLADPALGHCRFSGEYNDPKLKDVLQAIQFAMDLQLEEKDTVLIIRGEGCPR